MTQAARPRDRKELVHWLRFWRVWEEELISSGLYAVPPEGTKVQSHRAGRPTERAAIRLHTLGARCTTVRRWMFACDPLQRLLAEHYTHGISVVGLAHRLNLPYAEVRGAVKLLPDQIWARWYEAKTPQTS